MEWQDEGVVIGVRQHGEASAILDLMTRQHGRHSGFVHGARSRRLRPCLQPGNGVAATWRSRIEEQLGTFTIEPRRTRAASVMGSALALHVVNHLCALLRLLPEREPHDGLFEQVERLLDEPEDRARTPAALVRFELALLAGLGFGLDLEQCAATGTTEDLIYVSPKSGRAVTRVAGAPYHDRLLGLPAFVREDEGDTPSDQDVAAGFRLAAHFLMRDVFAPRGLAMPDSRDAYLRHLGLRQ